MQQVIWITGASSGIGEAVAVNYARRGQVQLILSSRRVNELARVKQRCVEMGLDASDIFVLPLDVVAVDEHAEKVATALQAFGQVDLLLNNAGISQRSWCVDTDLSVYRQLFEVDVIGQISLTKALLPHFIDRQSGHFAITSSLAGKFGAPLRTGYSAAKHAVMGFFDALRTEVTADGISVSTITPGSIATAVSANALRGDGERFGITDQRIANGMDVDDCAQQIVEGLINKAREIAVSEPKEMAILHLKREDPERCFDRLESMAGILRAEGIY